MAKAKRRPKRKAAQKATNAKWKDQVTFQIRCPREDIARIAHLLSDAGYVPIGDTFSRIDEGL